MSKRELKELKKAQLIADKIYNDTLQLDTHDSDEENDQNWTRLDERQLQAIKEEKTIVDKINMLQERYDRIATKLTSITNVRNKQ